MKQIQAEVRGELQPGTVRLQVRRSNHSATLPSPPSPPLSRVRGLLFRTSAGDRAYPKGCQQFFVSLIVLSRMK